MNTPSSGAMDPFGSLGGQTTAGQQQQPQYQQQQQQSFGNNGSYGQQQTSQQQQPSSVAGHAQMTSTNAPYANHQGYAAGYNTPNTTAGQTSTTNAQQHNPYGYTQQQAYQQSNATASVSMAGGYQQQQQTAAYPMAQQQYGQQQTQQAYSQQQQAYAQSQLYNQQQAQTYTQQQTHQPYQQNTVETAYGQNAYGVNTTTTTNAQQSYAQPMYGQTQQQNSHSMAQNNYYGNSNTSESSQSFGQPQPSTNTLSSSTSTEQMSEINENNAAADAADATAITNSANLGTKSGSGVQLQGADDPFGHLDSSEQVPLPPLGGKAEGISASTPEAAEITNDNDDGFGDFDGAAVDPAAPASDPYGQIQNNQQTMPGQSSETIENAATQPLASMSQPYAAQPNVGEIVDAQNSSDDPFGHLRSAQQAPPPQLSLGMERHTESAATDPKASDEAQDDDFGDFGAAPVPTAPNTVQESMADPFGHMDSTLQAPPAVDGITASTMAATNTNMGIPEESNFGTSSKLNPIAHSATDPFGHLEGTEPPPQLGHATMESTETKAVETVDDQEEDGFGDFGAAPETGQIHAPAAVSADPFGHLDSTEQAPPPQLGITMDTKTESNATEANPVETVDDDDDFGDFGAAPETGQTNAPAAVSADPFGHLDSTEQAPPPQLGVTMDTKTESNATEANPVETVDDDDDFGDFGAAPETGQTDAPAAVSADPFGHLDSTDQAPPPQLGVTMDTKTESNATEANPVETVDDDDDFGDFGAAPETGQTDAPAALSADPFGHLDSTDQAPPPQLGVTMDTKTESTGTETFHVETVDDDFGDFGAAPETGQTDAPAAVSADPFGHLDSTDQAPPPQLGVTMDTKTESNATEANPVETVDDDDDFGDFGAAPETGQTDDPAAESADPLGHFDSTEQAPPPQLGVTMDTKTESTGTETNPVETVDDQEEDGFGDFGAAPETGPTDAPAAVSADPFGHLDSTEQAPPPQLGVTMDNKTESTGTETNPVETVDDDFGDFGAAPENGQTDAPAAVSANPFGHLDSTDQAPPPQLGVTMDTKTESNATEANPVETVDDDDDFGDFGAAPENGQTDAPVTVSADPFGHLDSTEQAPPPQLGVTMDTKTESNATEANPVETVDDDDDFGDFGAAPETGQTDAPAAVSADPFGHLDSTDQAPPPQLGVTMDTKTESNATEANPVETVDDDDDFGDFGAAPETGQTDAPAAVSADPFGHLDSTDQAPPPQLGVTMDTKTESNATEANPVETVDDGFGDFGAAPETGQTDAPAAVSADPFGHLDSTDQAPPPQLGVTMDNKTESTGTETNPVETVDDDDDFGDFGAAPETGQTDDPAAESADPLGHFDSIEQAPSPQAGLGLEMKIESNGTETEQMGPVDDGADFGDFGTAADGRTQESSAVTSTDPFVGLEGTEQAAPPPQVGLGLETKTESTGTETNPVDTLDDADFGDFGRAWEGRTQESAAATSSDPFGHLEVAEPEAPPQLGQAMDKKMGSTGTENIVETVDGDDDFGDFGTAPETVRTEDTAAAPSTHPFGAEINEHVSELTHSVDKLDDDFGDFGGAVDSAEAENAALGASVNVQVADDADDFGDFGGAYNSSGPTDDQETSAEGEPSAVVSVQGSIGALSEDTGFSSDLKDDEFLAPQDGDLAAYGISMDSNEVEKKLSNGKSMDVNPEMNVAEEDDFGDFGSAAVLPDSGMEVSAPAPSDGVADNFGAAEPSQEQGQAALPGEGVVDDGDFGDFGAAVVPEGVAGGQQIGAAQAQTPQDLVSSQEDNFGNFNSGPSEAAVVADKMEAPESNIPGSRGEDDDNDFGDFGSATPPAGGDAPPAAVTSQLVENAKGSEDFEDDDDFGDFGSAAVKDDVKTPKQAIPTKEFAAEQDDDNDDDFGSFGSASGDPPAPAKEAEARGETSMAPAIESYPLLQNTRASFEKLFGGLLTTPSSEESAGDIEPATPSISIGEFLSDLGGEASPDLLSDRASLDEMLEAIKRPESAKPKILLASQDELNPFFYPAGVVSLEGPIAGQSEAVSKTSQSVPRVLDVKLLSVEEAAPDLASPDVSPRHVVQPPSSEITGTVVALPPLNKN